MTLLLGPPGCGKTTLLLALAGKLDKSLKVLGTANIAPTCKCMISYTHIIDNTEVEKHRLIQYNMIVTQ